MVYESSYESGRKPFLPDTTRGHWESPTDFIYVCLSWGLKLDVLLPLWMYFCETGVFAIVPYLFCLLLYVVPIFIIQSFMGQFSSSGFMSVFRIAPLFKGIGYVSLAANLCVLAYYSIFAAVPILFLFNSFRPILPWSCEAYKDIISNTPYQEKPHICNFTTEDNNQNIVNIEPNATLYKYQTYNIPSVIYFRSLFGGKLFALASEEFYISWQLLVCNLFAWGIIALVFYKYFNTEKLGKLLRYMFWAVLSMLVICIIRFAFLPGAAEGLLEYVNPDFGKILLGFPSIPLFVLSAFGPGWGSIVTLSSFNKFKTNITTYSWIICLGQMLIFMLFGLVIFLLEQHLAELTDGTFLSFLEHHWMIYLSSASAISSMELPNMWSIVFYSMLTLIAFIVMIPQLYCVLVSIFDEFYYLRAQKRLVTMSLIGSFAVLSTYFCSNEGIMLSSSLTIDSVLTQTAINLLLLLVVLWIYGRERFQRDFEFLLSRPFATWKVNMLRFVSPICLLFSLLLALGISFFLHMFSTVALLIIAVLLIMLPWIFIPVYGVICMLQTTGSLWLRFKRCCRPTDWYPVETEDRQRYEEAMGNLDITHQLKEVPAY